MSHSLWVYPVLISPIFIGYNSQAAGESSIIKESITSCSDICSTFWKIIRRIKFTNDGFFGITNERIRSIKLTLRPIICTTIVTGVSARCSIFKCPIIWFLTIKITTDTMNSILIFSIGTIQRFSKFYLEALKRDTIKSCWLTFETLAIKRRHNNNCINTLQCDSYSQPCLNLQPIPRFNEPEICIIL